MLRLPIKRGILVTGIVLVLFAVLVWAMQPLWYVLRYPAAFSQGTPSEKRATELAGLADALIANPQSAALLQQHERELLGLVRYGAANNASLRAFEDEEHILTLCDEKNVPCVSYRALYNAASQFPRQAIGLQMTYWMNNIGSVPAPIYFITGLEATCNEQNNGTPFKNCLPALAYGLQLGYEADSSDNYLVMVQVYMLYRSLADEAYSYPAFRADVESVFANESMRDLIKSHSFAVAHLYSLPQQTRDAFLTDPAGFRATHQMLEENTWLAEMFNTDEEISQ